ncbi:MAG: outer membrane beta-barrel protein [Bernardetiaceae bacterium]|nr:outer membrane beta-barrel protein [Bernardetiaceae bacterium]
MYTIKKIFCILLFCGLSFSLQAQKEEFGFTVGALNYTGDIASQYQIRNLRPAGEFCLRYNFIPSVSARVSGLYGKLGASDRDQKNRFKQQRGVEFSADVLELQGRIEYNFRDFRAYSELTDWSPFIFVGGAVSWITTTTNYSQNPDYLVVPSVPFGVGFKYRVAYGLNFGAEFGARLTYSDAIDGLDSDDLQNKFQSQNPFNNDRYYYLGLHVSWTFQRVICPVSFH